MTIGFFDSGVGGLTVLSKAIERCPSMDWLYYCDTDHLPYGEKTREEIREYVKQSASFLYEQGAAAIVVACNTATSAAIDDVRSYLPIPVIGMEPAVSLAYRQMKDKNKRILVLATQLTLKEEKYRKLLKTLKIEHLVDGLALPDLIFFAENMCFDESTVIDYLKKSMSHLNLDSYASVVLGCTHFPFFRSIIAKLFPPSTLIVDGAVGTVNNLLRHMDDEVLSIPGSGSITYFCSGRPVTAGNELERMQFLLDRIKAEDLIDTSSSF